MTSIQKDIKRKLQIEHQVLSIQMQNMETVKMSGLSNDIEVQMRGRLQVRLASIERAILRLEKGTFGVCQSCGEEIDKDRLEALPYAEQCIDCQRKLERKIVQRYAYSYRAA